MLGQLLGVPLLPHPAAVEALAAPGDGRTVLWEQRSGVNSCKPGLRAARTVSSWPALALCLNRHCRG